MGRPLHPDPTAEQEMLGASSVELMDHLCGPGEVRDLGTVDGAAYRRAAAELGWFGFLAPAAVGGGTASGDGLADATAIAFERGARLQPLDYAAASAVATALAADPRHHDLLAGIVAGTETVAWATDVFDGPGLTVTPTADGVRLDGVIPTVADLDGSTRLVVTIRHHGSVLVPADADGVTATALDTLDLTRPLHRLTLRQVAVPAAARVEAATDDLVRVAALVGAAETVGTMERAFDLALDHAGARVAFGRPIGSFQAVKHLLADTSLRVEMGKAVVAGATGAAADGPAAAGAAAGLAKAFVAEAAMEVGQATWQVLGGIGFTWEHDHHLLLRRLATDAQRHGGARWHRARLWSTPPETTETSGR